MSFGSNYKVMVHLMKEEATLGTDCRQILGDRRLLKSMYLV